MDDRQTGTGVPLGRLARCAFRPAWLCGLRGHRSRLDKCPDGTVGATEQAPIANRAAKLSFRKLLSRAALRYGRVPKFYEFSLAG